MAAFAVGEHVIYYSVTTGQYVEAQIIAVDQTSGAVQANVKPGVWISRSEQPQKIFRKTKAAGYNADNQPHAPAQSNFNVGDHVEYLSVNLGKWIPSVVLEKNLSSGEIKLHVKDAWIAPEMQSAKVRCPQAKPSPAVARDTPLLAVGHSVLYASPTAGGQISAIVVAVQPETHAVQLDIKPGFWMSAQIQAERITTNQISIRPLALPESTGDHAFMLSALQNDKALHAFADSVFARFDTDESGDLSLHEVRACMDVLAGKLGSEPVPDSYIVTHLKGSADREQFLAFLRKVIAAEHQDVGATRHKSLMDLARGPPAIIDLDDGFLGVIMDTGHSSLDFFRQAYECVCTKPAKARELLRRFAMEYNVDRYMIEAAFRHFDKDGDGTLEREEIVSLIRYLGLGAETSGDVSGAMPTLSCRGRIIDQLFKEIDIDGNGVVSLSEFQLWVLRQGGVSNLFAKRRKEIQEAGGAGDGEQVSTAILQEAGINPWSISFWGLSFPASERAVIATTTPCQRRALCMIRKISETHHLVAMSQLTQRMTRMGFQKHHVTDVLNYVREQAPVTIHMQLDREIPAKGTLLDVFLNETHYRNQFETNVSGGCMDLTQRAGWERNLFGDAYDNATPFERPKYGVVNFHRDGRGIIACHCYGDSYFELKNVRLRSTLASEDSCTLWHDRISCIDFYAHILNEYADHELQTIMEIATGKRKRASSQNQYGTYKEVQIHGEVKLNRDIQRLVVSHRHWSDAAMRPKLLQFSKTHGIEVCFMFPDHEKDPIPHEEADINSAPAIELVPFTVIYLDPFKCPAGHVLERVPRGDEGPEKPCGAGKTKTLGCSAKIGFRRWNPKYRCETCKYEICQACLEGSVRTPGKPTCYLCPGCFKNMLWSDYAEGSYATGWMCNNSTICGSGFPSPAHGFRFLCSDCTIDYCMLCVPNPFPPCNVCGIRPAANGYSTCCRSCANGLPSHGPLCNALFTEMTEASDSSFAAAWAFDGVPEIIDESGDPSAAKRPSRLPGPCCLIA